MKPIPCFSVRNALRGMTLALTLLSGFISAAKAEGALLDYDNQPTWSAVLGDRQSPIALDSGSARPDLDDDDNKLRISRIARDAIVADNRQTIQVNVSPGNLATIRGRRFQLQQFHFHTPSEHTIDGKRYPLEVHFVYRAGNGRLAVIAVLFQEGVANPAFEAVMQRVVRAGQAAPMREIDIGKLLPADLSYFHYLGSLTTPPLSQNVEWQVLSQPLSLSATQIDNFARYYKYNSRDLQPLNNREVLYYTDVPR